MNETQSATLANLRDELGELLDDELRITRPNREVSGLTPEARGVRIADLEKQLASILIDEHKQKVANLDPLLTECRKLKAQGEKSIAVVLYSRQVGCGLRDAHDVVTAIEVEHPTVWQPDMMRLLH